MENESPGLYCGWMRNPEFARNAIIVETTTFVGIYVGKAEISPGF